MRSLFILLCAISLVGCIAPGHIPPGKITKISQGMSKDEVIKKLGSPTGIKSAGNTETIYYLEERPWGNWANVYVRFVDGKVTEYGEDKKEEKK
jgi:outer membrane protein assembly factor BamE (lipoprotein component of BamABCDE complex)